MENHGRVLRIGHRGAAGHAPENTLPSIERAIEFGVDVVEIDIHRSLDGHLMVIHDARVDRTTSGTGYVCDLTRAQMPEIPTLSEVLEAINGRAELMIEMKVRGIADEVVRQAGSHRVLFASFFHSELLRIRERKPDVRTIALIDGVPVNPTAFAIEAKATHAGIGCDSLEQEQIDLLHAAGIKIFTWTVNDPRDIAHVISLGVDGVISNFPDRLP